MEGVPMADHEHTGDDACVDAGQNLPEYRAVSGWNAGRGCGGVAKHLLDDGPAPTPGGAPEAWRAGPHDHGRRRGDQDAGTQREVSNHALAAAGRASSAPSASASPSPESTQQGVAVRSGTQAAIDVAIVAEFGVAIHELADAIRENVIVSVERMTGLEVTEVNVTVHDVHLPQDDDEDEDHGGPQPARVL